MNKTDSHFLQIFANAPNKWERKKQVGFTKNYQLVVTDFFLLIITLHYHIKMESGNVVVSVMINPLTGQLWNQD
jgi:hypothetical protein